VALALLSFSAPPTPRGVVEAMPTATPLIAKTSTPKMYARTSDSLWSAMRFIVLWTIWDLRRTSSQFLLFARRASLTGAEAVMAEAKSVIVGVDNR
jgi:hypothetical protein